MILAIGGSMRVASGTVPGEYTLARTLSNRYFVDVHRPTHHNVLGGLGTLSLVDLRPAGVTEGTFEGAALDLDPGERILVRRGRFRLTMPVQ
jgi:hypothetical protein